MASFNQFFSHEEDLSDEVKRAPVAPATEGADPEAGDHIVYNEDADGLVAAPALITLNNDGDVVIGDGIQDTVLGEGGGDITIGGSGLGEPVDGLLGAGIMLAIAGTIPEPRNNGIIWYRRPAAGDPVSSPGSHTPAGTAYTQENFDNGLLYAFAIGTISSGARATSYFNTFTGTPATNDVGAPIPMLGEGQSVLVEAVDTAGNRVVFRAEGFASRTTAGVAEFIFVPTMVGGVLEFVSGEGMWNDIESDTSTNIDGDRTYVVNIGPVRAASIDASTVTFTGEVILNGDTLNAGGGLNPTPGLLGFNDGGMPGDTTLEFDSDTGELTTGGNLCIDTTYPDAPSDLTTGVNRLLIGGQDGNKYWIEIDPMGNVIAPSLRVLTPISLGVPVLAFTSRMNRVGTLTLPTPTGGLPPYTYQWSYNGVEIAGATNAVLAVAHEDETGGLGDEFAYSVVVDDDRNSPANAGRFAIDPLPEASLSIDFNEGPTGTLSNTPAGDTFNQRETIEIIGTGTDSDGDIVTWELHARIGTGAFALLTMGDDTDINGTLIGYLIPDAADDSIVTFRLTITDDNGTVGTVTRDITVRDAIDGTASYSFGTYVTTGGGVVSTSFTDGPYRPDPNTQDVGTTFTQEATRTTLRMVSAISQQRVGTCTLNTAPQNGGDAGMCPRPDANDIGETYIDTRTLPLARSSSPSTVSRFNVPGTRPLPVAANVTINWVLNVTGGTGGVLSFLSMSDTGTAPNTYSFTDPTYTPPAGFSAGPLSISGDLLTGIAAGPLTLTRTVTVALTALGCTGSISVTGITPGGCTTALSGPGLRATVGSSTGLLAQVFGTPPVFPAAGATTGFFAIPNPNVGCFSPGLTNAAYIPISMVGGVATVCSGTGVSIDSIGGSSTIGSQTTPTGLDVRIITIS